MMKTLLSLCLALVLLIQVACASDSTETKKDTTEMTAKPDSTETDAKKPDSTETDAKKPEIITTKSGLQYIDHVVGDGVEAKKGMNVSLHYTGWLYVDGKKGDKFDSSVDRGTPFGFRLGAGQVIRGWDEGVAGMKVGGKRDLIIPYELGYGVNGRPGIPPKAIMFFELELMDAK